MPVYTAYFGTENTPYTFTVPRVFDGSSGSTLFIAKVRKMMGEGWADPDFAARQFVDDYYRETGTSYHYQQHIIEAMISEVMNTRI